MRIDANRQTFELVTVLEKPMLFTDLRVDRNTVPKGMYLYEVRHADEDWGDPCQIGEWIMVNHFGSLITNEALALEKSPTISNAYCDIDSETEWNFEDEHLTLKEYMKMHPPHKEKTKDIER